MSKSQRPRPPGRGSIRPKRTTRTPAPPGSLPEVGVTRDQTLHVIAFGPDDFYEARLSDVAAARALRERFPVVWIDLIGHGDVALLDAVRNAFGLHALAIEDVANLGQRPKVEDYHQNLFTVVRMLEAEGAGLVSEQLALFLLDGVLVTFQERSGDCLDSLRERIRDARGRVRSMSSGYLFYSVLDAVIDGYFPLIESVGDRVEALEEDVLFGPNADPIGPLHEAKRDLLMLRKTVFPLREAFGHLRRSQCAFIGPETELYLRDAADHVQRACDTVEVYRDLANSVMDAHISVVSHRLNDVMALLTIISTIFIPLGFLTGLYGMNFDSSASRWNMPELAHPFGYPVLIAAMLLVSAGQLIFFWRRGWLRAGRNAGY